MGKKIGAYIVLDGEKEYKAAVSSCNKSLATLRSEMKLVDAQTYGNANSIDALSKKHEVLEKTLNTQKQKEKEIAAALEHAKKVRDSAGEQLTEYRGKLEAAKSALEEMEKASDVTEDTLKKQREEVESLNKTVLDGEEKYRKAGDRIREWEKQQNNAKAQTIKMTAALKENDIYLEEAKQATDKYASSIDKFGEKTKKINQKLLETKDLMKADIFGRAIETGVSAMTNSLENSVSASMDLDTAQKQLQASTGATAEETRKYGEELKQIYSAGYGDDITSIADGMALVRQYTNEINPTKLQEMTENALALEGVFGMDIGESIRAVDMLMDEMGLSAESAFDYIAKGAQNGLNRSGELTDNLTEYTALWNQAGFSAEEMFTILQNGLNSGAYNLDKVNDYVKEFGNSLADGRIEDNLSAFSGETQELFQQWKNGEATTKDVFRSVISDLAGMENQQKALTIASNTWSSLGEDNAMKVITSLNDVNTTYKQVHGTMESVKDIRYDSLETRLNSLSRKVQVGVIEPIATRLLPIAEKVVDFASENTGVIIGAGAAIAGIFVASKVEKAAPVFEKGFGVIKKGVEKLIAVTVTHTGATKAQAVATGEAAAMQTALNTSMLASPIAILAVGTIGVVGALELLSGEAGETTEKLGELATQTEESKESLEDAAEKIQESIGGLDESLEDIAAKEGLADNLIEDLYALAQQAEKTDVQIGVMVGIVDQINTLFPEVKLSIDESTGALNIGEEALRKYIDTAVDTAKAAAAQEHLTEVTKAMVDAELERYKAEYNLKEIEGEKTQLQNKRVGIENKIAEATRNGTSALVEYNGEMMNAESALALIAEAEQELTNQYSEQEDAMKGLDEVYKEAEEEYTLTKEALESMSEQQENATEITKEQEEAVKSGTEANREYGLAMEESAGKAETAAGSYYSLSENQKQLAQEVSSYVLATKESIASTLESQMNMFEQFDGGVQMSTQELLSNMESQITGVQAWEQNLSTLVRRGVDEGILQQLIEMGPSAAGYVATFANMSDEELKKANELWRQSVDIKSVTDDWGQQLLENGAASIAGGMEQLNGIMLESGYEPGKNTVVGFADGVQENAALASDAAFKVGDEAIDSINEAAGCQSPSKKTKETGSNVMQGLINGMNSKRYDVKGAAQEICTLAIQKVSETFSFDRFKTYGMYVTMGLASGIRTGKSEVISEISKLCRETIETANTELEINSPSKKFRGVGHSITEGLGMGVQEGAGKVNTIIRESMPYADISKNFSGITNTPAFNGITLEVPIYINGIYTETQIQRIAEEGMTEDYYAYNRGRGLRINVG